jgi:hypothetical protein
MTNPTTGTDKSNAGGWFPQVFMAESSAVDILLKDAAGVTLSSYVNVIALGSDTGALLRDFGIGGRSSIRGSGGTVYYEAGDPTGDDIGGTMSLGGWNGTQADSITLNGAAVNVTGILKEGGKKSRGFVYTEGTFSASAGVAIALTNTPTGVRAWDIEVIDLFFSTAGTNFGFLLSYDGGATYVVTATYGYVASASHGTTNAVLGGSGLVKAFMSRDVKTPANTPAGAIIRVTTPNSGSNATVVSGRVSSWENAVGEPKVSVFSAWDTTGGRATHIKLYPAAGTITGVYRTLPQRGFGET